MVYSWKFSRDLIHSWPQIIGPRNPSQPTSVRYINTTHSTATIEWRISSVTYTPETYYIEHGTSPSMLDQQSLSVRSGSDLTITNQLYSVDITGLTSNTTYYYRAVASNSFASTPSTLKTFITISLRKYLNGLKGSDCIQLFTCLC